MQKFTALNAKARLNPIISIFIFCQLLSAATLSGQSNSTELYPLSLPVYNYIDSTVYIGYLINNNMGDTVHSLSISYTVNGGARVSATIPTWVTGSNGGKPVSLIHPVPLRIHAAGDYVIHATVDSIDHVASDLPSLDSVTAYTHFYAASPKLHKRVVFEEFTGAWCGHCSGGAYDMQTIVSSDTDFILVAAHVASSSNPLNDSMNTPEAVAMHDVWAGYPGVTINRNVFESDGRTYAPNALYMVPIIEGLANQVKNSASPANVSISNLVYDTVKRLLTVDVNAEFLATISHGDYRVNLTLIEDSIIHPHDTTTDYSWNQNNYFFSHLSPAVDDTIPSLFSLGQELLDNGKPGGWVHNHVLRKMLGGAWGDTGTIPKHPIAGSTYNKQYTFTVPVEWHEQQLSLVAMVQEFHPINTSHQPANWSNPDLILNAVKQPLFPAKQTIVTTGIMTPQGAKARIYPNPSNGMVTIENPGAQSAILFINDMSGRTVFEKTLLSGSNTVHIDISPGIYQLSVVGSGTIQNEKLVIMR